jgi:hypothetical protein
MAPWLSDNIRAQARVVPAELARVSIRRVEPALITPASFARMKAIRDSTVSHLGRRGLGRW